ncbi:MAG: DUF1800 domain-containing protein [Chloroflexi bacterium]|nr:DUF1800 domain-containing protein [Chloroflexota bacterium]
MTLSRRDFLRLAGLVASGVATSACAPVYNKLAGDFQNPANVSSVGFPELSRLTFGPRGEDRARVAEIGLNAWIEEQLAPEAIDDAPADWRLRRFPSLNMDANEIFEMGNKLFDDLDVTPPINELRQATLTCQVYSRRQLYEVMAEFWSDHFNISVNKGICWFLKTVDDRETIRKHALGNFRDLLWASAHSPAMLVYLDNQVNYASHPNENYAREIMELHTLGVGGGYTQRDVMELARCFTGWTVKEHFWYGDFTFNPDFHDTGVKEVLGLTIQPNGQSEAEQVIETLATHPSTARFVATKLARRFIADEPPEEIVERAATAFAETDGDIKAVLRVILFEGLAYARPKFKRPVNFITSSLRALNAQTDAGQNIVDTLARMGQLPFGWPTPDGYPDRAAPWSGNLMPRWQFAMALARNEINGTQINLTELTNADSPSRLIDHFSSLLIGVQLPATKRDELAAALQEAGATDGDLPPVIVAGLAASPAFQWR